VATERGARDRQIAALAYRQHGVVALPQLNALGLTAAGVRRRVASGPLHPIHRGVYAVGHAVLTLEARLMAAVLACGPGALVSHRSAAEMWGLLDDSRPVIDVLAAANRRSRRGIAFHRVRQILPGDSAKRQGVPVTSLPRTLLDIAEVVPPRRLVYAIERAEKLRLLDLRALEACLGRSRGRRGIKPLRQALRETDPEALYAHDGLERLFIAFCRDRELPPPTMNAVVEGFTVDALWAKQKLIVELDSWRDHRARRAFEQDRRRDGVLKLAGYEVLRVTYNWLEHEPADLELTITRLLSEPPSLAATA
jgi:hypothetical protein